MAGAGESRSLYVVQRHFRRVRRGYDPEEVDRHLHVVSEWLRQGRSGESVRDLEAELHSRERDVAQAEDQARRLLEDARAEAQATLE
ncbi:MAG: DivIVA protein, partial [Solirubrobacteraceae bacterium]|nr:DivIVA protein [Solirubrobacteraceae bacterium]